MDQYSIITISTMTELKNNEILMLAESFYNTLLDKRDALLLLKKDICLTKERFIYHFLVNEKLEERDVKTVMERTQTIKHWNIKNTTDGFKLFDYFQRSNSSAYCTPEKSK